MYFIDDEFDPNVCWSRDIIPIEDVSEHAIEASSSTSQWNTPSLPSWLSKRERSAVVLDLVRLSFPLKGHWEANHGQSNSVSVDPFIQCRALSSCIHSGFLPGSDFHTLIFACHFISVQTLEPAVSASQTIEIILFRSGTYQTRLIQPTA